jgi:membrane protein DedA with SNARE-associated domain
MFMSQLSFNIIIGTLLRSSLMLLAGWLAAKGMLPSGSMEEWVGAVVIAVLTLLWSFWKKLEAKWHLDAALAAPAGTSLQDAVDLAKAGK